MGPMGGATEIGPEGRWLAVEKRPPHALCGGVRGCWRGESRGSRCHSATLPAPALTKQEAAREQTRQSEAAARLGDGGGAPFVS